MEHMCPFFHFAVPFTLAKEDEQQKTRGIEAA